MVKNRELETISNFGAFLEFTDEEAEDSKIVGKCDKCNEPNTLIVPREEIKETFREELLQALPRGVPNLAPSLRHFWYFARCSQCGEEIVSMRS